MQSGDQLGCRDTPFYQPVARPLCIAAMQSDVESGDKSLSTSPPATQPAVQPEMDRAGPPPEPETQAPLHRDISVRGRALHIYEHNSLMDPQTGRALTGAWVWDCVSSWPNGWLVPVLCSLRAKTSLNV